MADLKKLESLGAKKIILNHASKLLGEEVWMVVKEAMQVKDLEIELENIDVKDIVDKKSSNYQNGLKYLAKVIVDWNLTLDGKKAPITPENISLLPVDDFNAIQDQVGMTTPLSDSKKNT